MKSQQGLFSCQPHVRPDEPRVPGELQFLHAAPGSECKSGKSLSSFKSKSSRASPTYANWRDQGKRVIEVLHAQRSKERFFVQNKACQP